MSTCQILLLEDEPLILMDLEFAAEDHGCAPMPTTNLEQALAVLDSGQDITVAVLDFSLPQGKNCLPVAQRLEERGIPYILHSGDLDRQDEAIHGLAAKLIAKPACAKRVIGAAMDLVAA